MAAIIIGILALCFMIIFHEIGHFTAAKLFDMKVYEFNFGMGPVLLKKQKGDTRYALRLFPIGGSVMLGEDIEPSDDPREFRNKPVWQRMIVITAGAFLNLVLGLILCVVIVAMSKDILSTTVGGFAGSAVSDKGDSALQVGDVIVKINGMSIITATDISYKLDNSRSKGDDGNFAVYEFVVKRGGERITLPNVTFAAKPNERGGMSYVHDFGVYRVEKTPLNVLNYAARTSVTYGRFIWLFLIDLAKGQYGLNDLSGPVGTVAAIGEETAKAETFAEKAYTIVLISALITINLGMFNLLPIPALDGARLLFFIIEAIRRKPLKPEIEGWIHFIGFAALMLLMLAVTFNDIRRLIFGNA